MTDLNLDGMAIAPGVVETIVSLAVKEVEGVASVGNSGMGGLRAVFASKPTGQGIDIVVNEDDTLTVSVRVDVYYGAVLPQVAETIRGAVCDAVTTQIGLAVACVDVYIDGIQFVD
ncbi:MAG: Asp23/Gls24 family envelope stress response protein [Eggerthellaceae bacterium]